MSGSLVYTNSNTILCNMHRYSLYYKLFHILLFHLLFFIIIHKSTKRSMYATTNTNNTIKHLIGNYT